VSYHYRTSAPFSAASPLFLALFLFGSIILYIAILFWTLNTSEGQCHLRIWFFALGFAIMFGALFSKTFRVYRVITVAAEKLKKISFPNTELLFIFGVVVVIEVILLVLWSSVGQPKAYRISPIQYRPMYDFYECSFTNKDSIFLGILSTYNILLCCVGIYCSIRIWNIPYQFYNESKSIGFSMYNMFFFLVIIYILQLVIEIDHSLKFMIRSFAIIISIGISIVSIFWDKIKHRNTKLSKTSVHKSNSSGDNSGEMVMTNNSKADFGNEWEKEYQSLWGKYEKLLQRPEDWQKEYKVLLGRYEKLVQSTL